MFITGRLLLGIGGVVVGAIGPVRQKHKKRVLRLKRIGTGGRTGVSKYVKLLLQQE
jgi:hypothetical protein